MPGLPPALPGQNRVVVPWRTFKAGSRSSERKNGWHLAEHAREATPYGMQRLLSQAVWDANLVGEDLREYVMEHLGQESAILVIDAQQLPQTWEEVGRGPAAILRDHRTSRELSSRRLSGLRHGPWTDAH
jgi:hypothetical protein